MFLTFYSELNFQNDMILNQHGINLITCTADDKHIKYHCDQDIGLLFDYKTIKCSNIKI